MIKTTPKEVLVEVTKDCNLHCTHCYNAGSKSHVLGADDWLRIFDTLRREGVLRLIILGGEPTLHPEFYRILQGATERFKEVVVETNGTTMTSLSSFPVVVSVSLEYSEREKNNKVRPDLISVGGVKVDHFSLACKKLKMLSGRKVVRFTLYQDSDVLKDLVFSKEFLGANAGFVPLLPVGNAGGMSHLVPSAGKLLNAYKMVFLFSMSSRLTYEVLHPQFDIWLMKNWESIRKSLKGSVSSSKLDDTEKYLNTVFNIYSDRGRSCGAGLTRWFISSSGEVSPCPFLQQFKMGNILNEKINSIKNRMENWNTIIAEIPYAGACESCYYRNVCGGGCVATFIDKDVKCGLNCPLTVEDDGRVNYKI